ncbi:MAG TPA: cation-transporting P-type ATPase, partial [Candidatus Limnocylindrales bacterium]|nr:cation-transporting P-type ATPase [Candidatus Limnocylindrales bacterium]
MTDPGPDDHASEPWRRDAADVAAGLGTEVGRGLTMAEAAAGLERYGPNRLESAPPVPAWRRFVAQFANPLVYLLLVAAGVSIVAWVLEGASEVPFEAIVILVI